MGTGYRRCTWLIYARVGKDDNNINVNTITAGAIPVDQEFIKIKTPEGKEKIKIGDDDTLYDIYYLTVGTETHAVAEKMVGNRRYLLIPKSSALVCVEMMPDELNLVTGLNYIFDLHLYSKIDDIFQSDFVSNNFKLICQKFDWKTYFDLSTPRTDLADLDIPIITKAGEFIIHLSPGRHGYVSLVKYQGNELTKVQIPENIDQALLAALVRLGLVEVNGLPATSQNINLCKDIGVLDDLYPITTIFKSEQKLSDTEINYIESLLSNLVVTHQGDYLIAFINRYYNSLVKKGITKEFIVQLCNRYQSLYQDFKILKLANLLVFHDLITFNELISLCENAMNDNEDNKLLGLSTLDEMIGQRTIKENDDIPHLLLLIEKGINDRNFNIQGYARNILQNIIIGKNLVGKNDIPLIVSLIKKIMENLTPENYFSVIIEIITTLLDKNLLTKNDIDKLLPGFRQLINASNSSIVSSAIRLIDSLIDQNLLDRNGLLILIQSTMNSEKNIRVTTIDWIINLIGKKSPSGQILFSEDDIAKLLPELGKMMNSVDLDTHDSAIKLINYFINNDLLNPDELLLLIQSAMNSEKVIRSTIDWIINLIGKKSPSGQILFSEDDIAKLLPDLGKMMNSVDLNTHDSAIRLMNYLLDKKLLDRDGLLVLIQEGMNPKEGTDQEKEEVKIQTVRLITDLIGKKLFSESDIPKLLSFVQPSIHELVDSKSDIADRSIATQLLYLISALVGENLLIKSDIPEIFPLIKTSISYSTYPSTQLYLISALVDQNLLDQSYIDSLLPSFKRLLSDENKLKRKMIVDLLSSLVSHDLLTTSSIAELEDENTEHALGNIKDQILEKEMALNPEKFAYLRYMAELQENNLGRESDLHENLVQNELERHRLLAAKENEQHNLQQQHEEHFGDRGAV